MAMQLRHLLLTTLEDPYNPRSWSGTPFNMRVALEKRVERVSVLANLKPRRTPLTAALRFVLGGKPPRYPLVLTAPAQRRFAEQTLQAIDRLKPDAMLTISSHCIVGMQAPPIPTFMFSDAPWLAWKETYRDFDPMPLLGPRFARQEAQAARRCSGLIFTSDWAVGEARRLYDMPGHKIHSIPMGAVWAPDIDRERLFDCIDRRPTDRVDLLFVGKDWDRKGGPLALEIARLIAVAGIGVTLHVVGCTPEIAAPDLGVVRVHGFLSLAVPEEALRLRDLYLRSHFLVVPTLAECFGLVFAEAQAFGLPPVSRAVQALPSIVEKDVSGVLLPVDAPAQCYVDRILALTRDRERYKAMARAARSRYESGLTWERFAAAVVKTIESA